MSRTNTSPRTISGNKIQSDIQVPTANRILKSYHEEHINNDVKIKRREHVACIIVIPQEYLYWHNHSCVKQQYATCKKHPYSAARTSVISACSFVRAKTHNVFLLADTYGAFTQAYEMLWRYKMLRAFCMLLKKKKYMCIQYRPSWHLSRIGISDG